MNVKGAKGLMKKPAFACLESEIQKVVVVSALLSNSKITVLCEPQRKFDPQSENAFWQLVSEWQGGKDGRVLWVLTSSEEFEK